MKYLGLLLDEHLAWKGQISVIENKVSNNLGVLCRTRRVLGTMTLKNLYFPIIHNYLSYGNIVWASTNRSKLKLASK